MKYIEGINRNQLVLFPTSMDEVIEQDNEVRLIDLFVDSLDMEQTGFEVILVNGRQTKNIKGKKTDILDCQWIQKLHTLGLLSASFLPDSTTDIIRTYSRHRQNLIKEAASTTLKMQKYLRLMNLRLDVVVKDIVGLTGKKIIADFISGQTDGKKLAKHRHYNIRKSEEEIAKALQYNGREDYFFALKQEWETYQHLQKQIDETDKEIKKLLEKIINQDENKKKPTTLTAIFLHF